tara:strand:- start:871 stop:1293 length:423 start_codon:yes stop_codon:yes gene_type:complete
MLGRMNMELKYKCFSCCDKKTEEEMTRKGRVMKSLCNECSTKKSVKYKSGKSPKKYKTHEEQQEYNKAYYQKNKAKIDKINIEARKNAPDFKCPWCSITIKYGTIWSHKNYGCYVYRENKWKVVYRECLVQLKKTTIKAK